MSQIPVPSVFIGSTDYGIYHMIGVWRVTKNIFISHLAKMLTVIYRQTMLTQDRFLRPRPIMILAFDGMLITNTPYFGCDIYFILFTQSYD